MAVETVKARVGLRATDGMACLPIALLALRRHDVHIVEGEAMVDEE